MYNTVSPYLLSFNPRIFFTAIQVKDAMKIGVVGGGAVGVEIAGDIMEDYKDKADVYLIHPRENLVNDEVNETFQSTIKAKLESLGVTMFLGMSLLHLCYTVCLC